MTSLHHSFQPDFSDEKEEINHLNNITMPNNLEPFKDKVEAALIDYSDRGFNQDECSGFIDGYEQAIKDTNAHELLEALIIAKKWLDERGQSCHWQDKQKINNAINKVTL